MTSSSSTGIKINEDVMYYVANMDNEETTEDEGKEKNFNKNKVDMKEVKGKDDGNEEAPDLNEEDFDGGEQGSDKRHKNERVCQVFYHNVEKTIHST
jgi:hypothetical protein